MRWITYVILGGVLVLALYIWGFIPGLPSGCDDRTIDAVASPDGQYVAAVVERTCNVDGVESRLRGVVLYEADSGFGGQLMDDAVYMETGASPIVLTWQNDRVLLVDPYGDGPFVEKLKSWNDILILYE